MSAIEDCNDDTLIKQEQLRLLKTFTQQSGFEVYLNVKQPDVESSEQLEE